MRNIRLRPTTAPRGAAACILALLLSAGPATAQPPDALEVTDLVVGEGRQIEHGWFAVIHYTGWVYDDAKPDRKGAQFIDTRSRGKPGTFLYGYFSVVPGLEAGMRGMKAGGRRSILVPPNLGYDDFKVSKPRKVPLGSALVFEVELLDVTQDRNPN
jgi:FKBP-type peptidyl-prolyl cis-trans isomerase FkpA